MTVHCGSDFTAYLLSLENRNLLTEIEKQTEIC